MATDDEHVSFEETRWRRDEAELLNQGQPHSLRSMPHRVEIVSAEKLAAMVQLV
jgi:hypothetical protein